MAKTADDSALSKTLQALQQLFGGSCLDDPYDIEPYGEYHDLIQQLNLVCLSADLHHEARSVRKAWDAIKHEHPHLRQALEGTLKPLHPYTAKELMAQRFAPRRWAVRPFFPEGLTILAGPPGIGKSYLALNLALAKAMGGLAFGVLQTDPGEVLYLSFEDDQQAMQERLDTVWKDEEEDVPATLYIQHEDVPKLGEGLVETLSTWLDEHQDAQLIVIDVLGDVKPPRKQSSDWYLDDKAMLTPLRRLANTRHVAIILLHHTNRRENPDNPFEMIHGGAGIEGTPDTKAVLMREMGKSDAVLAIRGRAVPEQRAAFSYHAGIWTYLGKAEDFERTEERQAILTYLRHTLDPVKPKHVAAMLGREESATRKLMRTMARQGEIRKEGYGLYTTHPIQQSNSGNSEDSDNSGNTGNSALETIGCENNDVVSSPERESNEDKSYRSTNGVNSCYHTLPRDEGKSYQSYQSVYKQRKNGWVYPKPTPLSEAQAQDS